MPHKSSRIFQPFTEFEPSKTAGSNFEILKSEIFLGSNDKIGQKIQPQTDKKSIKKD